MRTTLSLLASVLFIGAAHSESASSMPGMGHHYHHDATEQLTEDKPSEALTEYRVALKLSPNRLNGLLSAGEAAEMAKQPAEARSFNLAAAQQSSGGAHRQAARGGACGYEISAFRGGKFVPTVISGLVS